MNKCPASVIIPTIPSEWSCRLGRVGIVEVDYALDQLHSSSAPIDSVWSTSYKTERTVLGGWSVNLSHLFTRRRPSIRLLLTRTKTWLCNNRGMILTLIHWLKPLFFQHADLNLQYRIGVRALYRIRKTPVSSEARTCDYRPEVFANRAILASSAMA